MSDHLTPEEFFEFIDRGGSSGPSAHHLTSCPECLFELDLILLVERPATAEEEAILDELPAVTKNCWSGSGNGHAGLLVGLTTVREGASPEGLAPLSALLVRGDCAGRLTRKAGEGRLN